MVLKKNIQGFWFFLGLFFLWSPGWAQHSPAPSKGKSVAPRIDSGTFVTGVGPSLNVALQALMPLGQTPLSEFKYCRGVVSDPRIKNPKMVDYFTDLIGALRDKVARNYVVWNCRLPPNEERAPKNSYNCDLLFHSQVNNGEPPFRYGFRLYFRDGRIPKKDEIECMGSG